MHLVKDPVQILFTNTTDYGLRTAGEEIAFTARPMHRPKFSDFFDLCLALHWVSVVRD